MPETQPLEPADPAETWRRMVAAHAEAVAVDPAGEPPEHRPSAAVLACSDARVPPSLIFGQPSGSLFVVRLAGNSATAGAVASLTYAVEQLGTDLVIVLGHTGCGAVTAALSATTAPELRAVLDPIDEMLTACVACDDIDAAVFANVRHNMLRLQRDRGPLGTAIRSGRVTVRGAVHDLGTGELIEVTPSTAAADATGAAEAPIPAPPSPVPSPNHQLTRSAS